MKHLLLLLLIYIAASCTETSETVTESQLSQTDERSREADTVARTLPPLTGEADRELASLVGLDEARAELDALSTFLELQQQRQMEGKTSPDVLPHYLFTGPSGTGKLPVARILAQLYRRYGVVGRGQVVEVAARSLLGESQSQTSRLVNAVADSAREGVLLITGVDSMLVFPNPTYVSEAMLTLLTRMQRDDYRMAVVLAGDAEKIGRLLEGFPDLKSRFTRAIAFQPYTASQLFSLFVLRAQEAGLEIESGGLEQVAALIDTAATTAGPDFEGAPLTRRLYDDMLTRQAARLRLIISRTHADTVSIKNSDVPEYVCVE